MYTHWHIAQRIEHERLQN